MTTYPTVDITLARRLERTEGTADAAFVDARAQLDPSVDATGIEVAGVYAMFDGVGAPLTQTFGLGLSIHASSASLSASKNSSGIALRRRLHCPKLRP